MTESVKERELERKEDKVIKRGIIFRVGECLWSKVGWRRRELNEVKTDEQLRPRNQKNLYLLYEDSPIIKGKGHTIFSFI